MRPVHTPMWIMHISTYILHTIEHPSSDGFIPFLDVLIHPDNTTSIYRKPTHTNLYQKYNSCTPNNTKNSVIRSLTRRAYNLCSPEHLQTEWATVRDICLKNGFPPQCIDLIMDQIRIKFTNKVNSLSSFNVYFINKSLTILTYRSYFLTTTPWLNLLNRSRISTT